MSRILAASSASLRVAGSFSLYVVRCILNARVVLITLGHGIGNDVKWSYSSIVPALLKFRIWSVLLESTFLRALAGIA